MVKRVTEYSVMFCFEKLSCDCLSGTTEFKALFAFW